MTDQESSSSLQPESESPPATETAVYKAIVAIGVSGTADDVTRFIALWITDAESRAHKIANKIMPGRITLLPLPEENLNGDV